jgi:hypothetical protein
MALNGYKMKKTPFGAFFTPALTSCPPAVSRIDLNIHYRPFWWQTIFFMGRAVITGLVGKCFTAKHRETPADTIVLEREIDYLVYDLYSLTPKESTLMEGSGRGG